MEKPDLSKKNEVPELLRTRLAMMTEENWDEFIATLKDIALGFKVEEIVTDKEGMPTKVRTYTTKPDKEVLQYLTNQVIGKPKESMNIEGRVSLVADESLSN